MKKLHLAPGLSLPIDAVTQTFAFLAKRGAGKTYTAGVLIEEMLKAEQQVVVIDPLDVWWGLRASADGKREGLPITVLGGPHGDLPLEEDDAELIAKLIVEQRISAVLSLRHFRKAERTRFLTPFYEQLYHLNREPLHLAVDEADASAPQKPMKGEERMLGAMEDIVRRGRSAGLGVSLISQRSAVLNKNVLTQVEVLVALRTIAPQDMAAVDAWIQEHGSEEQREVMMSSLPSLPIGDSWWWSPGWLDVFKRIRVRPKETFDSSKTPKVGETIRKPKKLAPVDLEQLRVKLAKTIEKAKADDPRELKKQIADRDRTIRQLQAGKQTEHVVEKRVADPAAVAAAETRGRKDVIQKLRPALAAVTKQFTATTNLANAIGELARTLELSDAERPVQTPGVPIDREPLTRIVKPIENPPAKRDDSRALPLDDNGQLNGGKRKIMNAIAELEALGIERPNVIQVALMNGVSHTTGTFKQNVRELAEHAYIERDGGRLALMIAGLAEAKPPLSPVSGDELRRTWLSKISGPRQNILRVAIDRHPDRISRVELAQELRKSHTTGTFKQDLRTLRNLGLLELPGDGTVKAAAVLFPAGLR